jgi:hypothetical protein
MQKPLEVLWVQTQPCPGQPLQPFGNRVKGTSNVPECEMSWYRANLLQMIEDLQDSRVCTVLHAKSMLIWMEETMLVPDTLNSRCSHPRLQFMYNLKKGDGSYLGEIVHSRFLGKESVISRSCHHCGTWWCCHMMDDKS